MGNEAELSLYAYPGAVVTERKQGHLFPQHLGWLSGPALPHG